jgi:hypothetical protein
MKKVFVILFTLLALNSIGFIDFDADTASSTAPETSVAFAADQDVQPAEVDQKNLPDELSSNSNLAILGLGVFALILARSRSNQH